MTVTTPSRGPETGRDRELERRVADLEALIEEARRRARCRRQRNVAVILAAMVVGGCLYWLLGSGQAGSGPVVASGTPYAGASPPKVALPEQLSFNANGSVVLLRRDGRRLPFLSGILAPPGELQDRRYAGLDWSPDGSKLLAGRTPGFGVQALVVTDETGKVVWTVDPRAVDGRWSPVGTRIAFIHVNREEWPGGPGFDHVLFVASSNRRHRTRIATHVRQFSWSPDGTKLAYPACARTCGPSRAQGAHRLVIADATGRRAPHPVPLPAGAGAPGRTLRDVQWSPEGSLIAFVSNDGVGVGMHLNVVDPDGSSLRRIADGTTLTDVQWSPDGSLIAFVSHDDVSMHVDVVHADGGSLRRVVVGPYPGGGRFEWSPDGKRLAIVVPTGPKSRDVYVVNADGTDLHRIARCRCDLRGSPPISESVAWSFDGTRIAYISGRGNTISTIRPNGSGATVVATQPARGVTGYWYPSSPLWRPTRKH
jgi:Tol biopolymer transport system component